MALLCRIKSKRLSGQAGLNHAKHALCLSDIHTYISDRPNPVSAEPNHFFAELCSAEPNGSAKVRPIWPNLFGRICRICSAVFAEHVRPYLPKVFGRTTTRRDCEIYLLTDHK